MKPPKTYSLADKVKLLKDKHQIEPDMPPDRDCKVVGVSVTKPVWDKLHKRYNVGTTFKLDCQ